MAQTIFDIATLASLKIGSTPIQSFTEATRENEALGNQWQQTLDSITIEGAWDFASTDFVLNTVVTAPVDPNWKYAFQLPGDFAKVRAVMSSAGTDIPYAQQGTLLYTNSTSVILKYVRKLTDTDIPIMPPWFIRLFVDALAYECAEPIIGSDAVRNSMAKDYAASLAQARRENSKNTPPKSAVAPSRLRNSRMTGTRWG